MQVNNSNNISNNMNFKALYMPKTKGLTSLKNTSDSMIFEWIKEPLEKMAEDVDIYVKSKGIFNKSYNITVGKVTKSPIKRFFGFIGDTIQKKIKKEDICIYNGNLTEMIMNYTKEAKEEFVNYKEYLTKS